MKPLSLKFRWGSEIFDFMEIQWISNVNIGHRNFSDAIRAYKNKNYTKAFQLAKKAEEANDDTCFALLGLCYYEGLGVDTDMKKAVAYFQKGLVANSYLAPLCSYFLSICYSLGRGGVSKSPELAFSYAKESVETLEKYKYMEGRIPNAFLCNLGYMYGLGIGAEKNPTMAIKYLRCPAEEGFPNARAYISEAYSQLGKKETAFLWALAGAERDDVLATFVLAQSYEYGVGCEKDLFLSLVLYRRAKELGLSFSCDKAISRVGKKLIETLKKH